MDLIGLASDIVNCSRAIGHSYTAYAWASVVTANLLLIARRQLD